MKKLGAFLISPKRSTVTTPASKGTLEGMTRGWSAAVETAVDCLDLDLVEFNSGSERTVEAAADER